MKDARSLRDPRTDPAGILPVQRLSSAAALPVRMTPGAAGLDLAACLPDGAPLVIPPGGRALVPTGIALAIPPGHEGQVRPRSGLALKHGIVIANAPGTIDADYRGEVKVILLNLGDAPFSVVHGRRIAQLVVARVEALEPVEVTGLTGSGRGVGGFGSTGG